MLHRHSSSSNQRSGGGSSSSGLSSIAIDRRYLSTGSLFGGSPSSLSLGLSSSGGRLEQLADLAATDAGYGSSSMSSLPSRFRDDRIASAAKRGRIDETTVAHVPTPFCHHHRSAPYLLPPTNSIASLKGRTETSPSLFGSSSRHASPQPSFRPYMNTCTGGAGSNDLMMPGCGGDCLAISPYLFPPLPVVASGPGIQSSGGVTVYLQKADLWRRFHSVGTEMIITKSGR